MFVFIIPRNRSGILEGALSEQWLIRIYQIHFHRTGLLMSVKQCSSFCCYKNYIMVSQTNFAG